MGGHAGHRRYDSNPWTRSSARPAQIHATRTGAVRGPYQSQSLCTPRGIPRASGNRRLSGEPPGGPGAELGTIRSGDGETLHAEREHGLRGRGRKHWLVWLQHRADTSELEWNASGTGRWHLPVGRIPRYSAAAADSESERRILRERKSIQHSR